MKVLHIISGDLWGGAEAMAFSLIKELSNYKNVQISAIILNEGKLSNKLNDLPIETKVIDEKYINFASIYKECKSWFTKNPHDVIHSHRYKENILAYLISRKVKNIKLVATQHGVPNSEQAERNINIKHRFVLEVNNKILAGKFDKLVVVSNDMKRYYSENIQFKEDALEMIHNGIILPNVSEIHSDKKVFFIGSIGRLFPVKDYTLFVKIANEISKVSKEIKYVLAGDGPERVIIQQLVNQYGLQDSFKIIGVLDDTTKFYQDIDVYLNTSLSEGLPLSVLEAMAHGVPVIAANVGGIKEIIAKEDQGILINGRNPMDFAEKCLMLVQNGNLRKSMGFKGRERIIDAFSVGKMAKKYYSLYSELINF